MKWCKGKSNDGQLPDDMWMNLREKNEILHASNGDDGTNALHPLEEPLQQHFEPAFQSFMTYGCERSPTLHYWKMFLDAAQILLLAICAERERGMEPTSTCTSIDSSIPVCHRSYKL